jgi:hypothetical protein
LEETVDEKTLAIIRAAIAGRRVLKKNLAKTCGVSRPYFSEFIHGDRIMPAEVRARLIAELGLEDVFRAIDAAQAEGAQE